MAKLLELLTQSEQDELKLLARSRNIPIGSEIKEMTVAQLSDISLTLIQTEHGDIMPDCVLSAEAINILNKRAVNKNISIF